MTKTVNNKHTGEQWTELKCDNTGPHLGHWHAPGRFTQRSQRPTENVWCPGLIDWNRYAPVAG